MPYPQAQKRGMAVPFTPHEPDYQVDLDAIPLGEKIAAWLALDLLDR